MNNNYTIIIDKLSFISFIKGILLSSKYKPEILYYFRSSSIFEKLMKVELIRKVFFRKYKFFSLDELALVPVENGLMYSYLPTELFKQREILAEKYLSNDRLLKNIFQKYDQEKVKLFLKSKLSIELADALKIILGAYYSNNINSNQNQYIAVLKNKPWLKDVRAYADEKSIAVESYISIDDIIYPFKFLVKYILEVLFNTVGLISHKKRLQNNEPKVGVPYLNGLDDRKRSDMFWFKGSNIDPKSILVYFLNSKKTINNDVESILKEKGFGYVSVIPKLFIIGPFKVFSEKVNFLGTLNFCKNLIISFSRVIVLTLKVLVRFSYWKWWELKHINFLLSKVIFYETFFKQENVKVNFAMHGFGDDMIASNIAIDACKGIDISAHWSNYIYLEDAVLNLHDIYFCWGNFHKELNAESPSLTRKYLLSGYIYDDFLRDGFKISQEIRKELTENGAEFVLSYFDEGYNKFEYPICRKEDFILMCRKLFLAIIEDEKLGLIIKTKRLSSFYRDIIDDDMKQIMQSAVDTGRCKVIDDRFPSEVALNSDLVLGLGVFNTAVLEAALTKKPFMILDFGLKMHPYYKFAKDVLVFNNFNIMWQNVQKYRLNRMNYLDNNAEFKEYLHSIDPFQDGQAAARIGKCIEDALELVTTKNNKNNIYSEVVNKYEDYVKSFNLNSKSKVKEVII